MSPSTSIAPPAISSPRSKRNAIAPNSQTTPFEMPPTATPPRTNVDATETLTIMFPGRLDSLNLQLYSCPTAQTATEKTRGTAPSSHAAANPAKEKRATSAQSSPTVILPEGNGLSGWFTLSTSRSQ